MVVVLQILRAQRVERTGRDVPRQNASSHVTVTHSNVVNVLSVAPTSERKTYVSSVLCHIDPERLRRAKQIVEHAVKTHKVFSVQGSYPIIRKALKDRGWVERDMPRSHRRKLETATTPINTCADDSDSDDSVNYEKAQDSFCRLMSRLLRNEIVYFYWTSQKNTINPKYLLKDQITNHFIKAGCFTTKVGLCMNLRNLHWFDSANPDTFFPRCYRLGAEDEKHAFIDDYRRTACFNFLKYILQREECKHKDQTLQENRKQSKQTKAHSLPEMMGFALKVCEDFLSSLEHSDVDCWETQKPTNEQWAEFLQHYYLMVQYFMCQTFRSHLKVVHCDPTIIKDSKWVAQKYIEKPFLVHGTKFDVRQWFLVTDWNPLTVWFYTKCYLRFSTQPFSLHSMDSSVHLCNNSIQRRLSPSEHRHPAIPKTTLGTVVVPEMKKALIYALLTAQDVMEPRKNSFELYGADFILDYDLHPWLIEINTSPTMAPSSPVTTRLCRAVQEDTIRVVLDRRADPNAYTGHFNMIYRQAAVTIPQYLGVSLLVEGTKLKVPVMSSLTSESTRKKHKGPDKVEE
ncbi:hypothetical protein WMY93_019845 [Mugilogobius chulae]|uniref:Uncharacterized protein n=1 Tax=Mugilogobius chulae TaxID=88201 RepID=A0AAW0NQD4_9GOBI